MIIVAVHVVARHDRLGSLARERCGRLFNAAASDRSIDRVEQCLLPKYVPIGDPATQLCAGVMPDGGKGECARLHVGSAYPSETFRSALRLVSRR